MKIYSSILLALFSILAVNTFGQQQFQQKYESTNASRAYVVKTTHDGGYILAGSYDVSGLLSAEYYVVKIDALGDTIWSNTYGPQVDSTLAGNRDGAGNEAYDIIETLDSGYLVVGEAHDSLSGKSNACIIKLSQNGDSLWGRTYGGLLSDYAYNVLQLADSGYILSGYTESFGTGIRNAYALRLDKLGDTIWTRVYGGAAIDGALDLTQSHDGGFVIVGNTFSFGAGNSDVYIIKFDLNGDLIWSKSYGGSLNDFGNAIALSQDKGFIISGSTESFGAGQRDVYLLKVDSTGTLEWSKTYGGSANESGKSILELSNQDIVVMGNTRSFGAGFEDYYFLKLNSMGDTIMTRVYGGQSIDLGESIQKTPDNGFVMIGFTNSFNTFNFDIYIVKTDSMGQSNCHQGLTQTQVSSATTTETSPATLVSSGGITGRYVFTLGKAKTNPINVCNINSLSESESFSFNLFPNPSEGFITISNSNLLIEELSVFDVNGKLIRNLTVNALEAQLDLSNLMKGVYFVHVKGENRFGYKKIILY